MHAPIPIAGRRSSVPAIPPCNFDAELRRAVASPDTSAPYPERHPDAAPGHACFPRRRFPHITNFFTGTRYRLLDAIDFVSRWYVRLCVLIVTFCLAVYLGITIARLMRSEPLPPPPSPSCPASHSPSHTSYASTGGFKFK